MLSDGAAGGRGGGGGGDGAGSEAWKRVSMIP